jgi:hypothetical protein
MLQRTCFPEILCHTRVGMKLCAAEASLSAHQDNLHLVAGEVYVIEFQGHRNLVTVKFGKNLVQVDITSDENWKVKDTA